MANAHKLTTLGKPTARKLTTLEKPKTKKGTCVPKSNYIICENSIRFFTTQEGLKNLQGTFTSGFRIEPDLVQSLKIVLSLKANRNFASSTLGINLAYFLRHYEEETKEVHKCTDCKISPCGCEFYEVFL